MMMTHHRHGDLALELVVDFGWSPLAVDDGWSPLSASFEWPVSMVKCFPLCNIRKSCHIFQ